MTESPEAHERLHRKRLFYLLGSGAIAIMLLVIGTYDLLEYMESPEFCGQVCHVEHYPESTVYKESPHSEVSCTECHIGSGASYLVKSKISGVPQIFSTLFHTYEKPFATPLVDLRPARDTCEQCHRPERFSGDLVRYYTTHLEDRKNTPTTKAVGFKVGGGQSEVASGIHWHIAAELWYLPLDDKRQEIAWAGVVDSDGDTKEFINPDKADELTPELIKAGKRQMDCIDCHNRSTHVFNSPEFLIDKALSGGQIDNSLPYISKKGLAALDPINANIEQANTKVEIIRNFYETNYPDIYVEKADQIDKAIEELKHIAVLTTFPIMEATWETHINNLSHDGCARCHGTLETEIGNESIGAVPTDTGDIAYTEDCELCHFRP